MSIKYIKTNYEDKLTNATFRIDKNIMHKLRQESKARGISLNTFINQIIKNFLDWYIFEPKIGMIPLFKPVVAELFRCLTKEVSNIATNVGKSAILDITLFMKSKVDIDAFLQWFELLMKNSSMQLIHSIDNNTHIYRVNHDICINYSYYYKVILDLIFEEIFKKK